MKSFRLNIFCFLIRALSIALLATIVACVGLYAAEGVNPYGNHISSANTGGYVVSASSKTLTKPSQASDDGYSEVDIQARTLDYDQVNKYLVAQGSITVT